MTETQQILEAIKDLKKGQESIRTELHDTRKALTAKIDAVQSDLTEVKETVTEINDKIESGSGSLSDDVNYLLQKMAKLEKDLKDLRQQHLTSK